MEASAFVVGPDDGAGAALSDLARAVGFVSVERYMGLAKAERQVETTPLVFFLCTAVAEVRTLKPMADAIRFSPSLKLRFSPVMYFAHELSIETIKQCIGMGFDDVIALPCTGSDLAERIGRQIGTPQTYHETSTYFGPDRRNGNERTRAGDNDHGGGQHRRIKIVRTAERGVDILSDDLQVVL